MNRAIISRHCVPRTLSPSPRRFGHQTCCGLSTLCAVLLSRSERLRRRCFAARACTGNESKDFFHDHAMLGQHEFWNRRYSLGDHIEWIANYVELERILECASSVDNPHVLNLGCGTSRLSEDMYDAGWKEITNVDISSVAVAKMRDRNHVLRPQMLWLVADATDMSAIPSNSFDLVLDKSTFDAIAAARNAANVVKLLAEVSRVLKVGGVYLLISLNKYLIGNPDVLKMPHVSFTIEVVAIGERTDCACIKCQKLADADDMRSVYLDSVLEQSTLKRTPVQDTSKGPTCDTCLPEGLQTCVQVEPYPFFLD